MAQSLLVGFTLAAFFDAGLNKMSLRKQLKMNVDRVDSLNFNYPTAGFDNRVLVAPGTEKLRTSTGLEMQIMMPVVNAPFRFYWAYNPTIVRQYLQPPVVLDRSSFPNQATFINSVANWGRATPFFEQRKTVRTQFEQRVESRAVLSQFLRGLPRAGDITLDADEMSDRAVIGAHRRDRQLVPEHAGRRRRRGPILRPLTTVAR